MKKFYNKILVLFLNLPVKLEILKTFFAEWYAILRKRPLYKNIKWTKEQQAEFDLYWKKNYGKTISNRWHKLYEASNGIHCVSYMPEVIYSLRYEPKVNDFRYSTVLADKTLNDLLFDNKIENVRTPNFFMFNNHGHFYNSGRALISQKEAVELLSNVGEAVIKPTVDSSSGKNVKIINMKDGTDIRTGKTASDIIKEYKSNYIVQERLKPCNELKTLYPNSINTIRVISYIVDSSVEVAPISLRIGGGGGEVDNIHAGGMSIGVDNDGNLQKYAYRLGYGDSFEKFAKHPDTNIIFDGYKLSFINELIASAKRLHEMVANIGMISWDFTVDSDGYIVVVEANYTGQSVWFPQMLTGRPLFGENTEKVLNFLKYGKGEIVKWD